MHKQYMSEWSSRGSPPALEAFHVQHQNQFQLNSYDMLEKLSEFETSEIPIFSTIPNLPTSKKIHTKWVFPCLHHHSKSLAVRHTKAHISMALGMGSFTASPPAPRMPVTTRMTWHFWLPRFASWVDPTNDKTTKCMPPFFGCEKWYIYIYLWCCLPKHWLCFQSEELMMSCGNCRKSPKLPSDIVQWTKMNTSSPPKTKRVWQTNKYSKAKICAKFWERLKFNHQTLGWWFLGGGFWMVEDLEDLQFHGASREALANQ